MSERTRALAWSLVFMVGGFALTLFLLGLLSTLPRLASSGGALWFAALQALVMLLVFGLFTWLVGVRALRLGAADFGVTPVGRGAYGFGRGFLSGLLLAALAMLAAVGAGRAEWRNDGGSPSSWLVTVILTGLVLLPAALAEEVIFRGVPLVALSRAFGRLPAIAGLALFFGLSHLLNPGVTPLAVANIAIAGAFLGFAFFTPGGLWSSTGAHLGWNLTLVALAAPVSGLPLPMPWLDYLSGGPAWLTGGPFGPEGGIFAALCLMAGTIWAARRTTREVAA